MTTGDWVQVGSMCALILVTGFYAWQTWAMAKEIRKQRLENRPVVIPDIDTSEGSYDENMRDMAQSCFPVRITNVGTVAAVELQLTLKKPPKDLASAKLPLLLPGANWKSHFSFASDFDKDGQPIWDMPPEEGLYEIHVRFRQANSSPTVEFSEVVLPFELHWSGESYYHNLKRQGLKLDLRDL
ncbi:MAG: hypothetical protein A2Y59_06480 [Chloroflexi bacterium RBG_13_52_14]|nr:MAG: hypothetical protein A2Y59_06480 [Chloroflexi bacterium RBG_13_52_14]